MYYCSFLLCNTQGNAALQWKGSLHNILRVLYAALAMYKIQYYYKYYSNNTFVAYRSKARTI